MFCFVAKECKTPRARCCYRYSNACCVDSYRYVGPTFLCCQDTYGLEKLYHEEMCKAYAKDFPIETRMARYHNVYGPRGTWKVVRRYRLFFVIRCFFVLLMGVRRWLRGFYCFRGGPSAPGRLFEMVDAAGVCWELALGVKRQVSHHGQAI